MYFLKQLLYIFSVEKKVQKSILINKMQFSPQDTFIILMLNSLESFLFTFMNTNDHNFFLLLLRETKGLKLEFSHQIIDTLIRGWISRQISDEFWNYLKVWLVFWSSWSVPANLFLSCIISARIFGSSWSASPRSNASCLNSSSFLFKKGKNYDRGNTRSGFNLWFHEFFVNSITKKITKRYVFLIKIFVKL